MTHNNFVEWLEHYCSEAGFKPIEIFEKARLPNGSMTWRNWKRGSKPRTKSLIPLVRVIQKYTTKSFEQLIIEALESEEKK